jgi:hypothetical protein
VELKLEAGDDAEVAAAAPQRPEQVLILIVARSHQAAVGQNDVGRQQIVDRQPQAARQVAEATAQGQTTHSGRRDHASRRGHAERVGRVVDVTPRGAASDPGDPLVRVDHNVLHHRQVDDQTAVHRAEARNAVAATPNREVQSPVPGGGDRSHHIGRVHASDDGTGLAVVHGVIDGASVVVVGIRRQDDTPPYRLGQGLDRVSHGFSWLGLTNRCPEYAPRCVP